MIKLPENLTVYHVKEVQEQLLNYLQELIEKQVSEVILDGSGVKDLDAAGLQLLLAAAKTYKEEGLSLSLANCGGTVEHLLEISGAAHIILQRRPKLK